nr:MAG: hypothetical protein [Bacteriophage sp.]
MATTNYSLPTILGTNAFDLVTDYNALANATDAALASVAGLIPTETITEIEGQISALQTLTGSQGAQITTLQSQMSAANGNISTLESGLTTANNNIGTLQTGLQGANSNISSINTGLVPIVEGGLLRANPKNNTNGIANYVAGLPNSYIDITLCINKKAQLVNASIAALSPTPIGAVTGKSVGNYVVDLTDYAEYLPSRNMNQVIMANVLSYTSQQNMFIYGMLDVTNKALNIVWQTMGAGYSSNSTSIIGGGMMWFYGVSNGVTL